MNITNSQPGILLLPTCKGIEAIKISEIVRIEAMSNYSRLYFANSKTLVVAKVLRWFEERLAVKLQSADWPGEAFLRIHRKHLINKQFIHRYIRRKNGRIEMSTGEWFDVSKRKKTVFFKCRHVIAA